MGACASFPKSMLKEGGRPKPEEEEEGAEEEQAPKSCGNKCEDEGEEEEGGNDDEGEGEEGEQTSLGTFLEKGQEVFGILAEANKIKEERDNEAADGEDEEEEEEE